MSAPLSADLPTPAPLEATRRALFEVAGLYEVASQVLGVREPTVIAARVVHSAIGTLRADGGALYVRGDGEALRKLYATAPEWPDTVPGGLAPESAQRLLRAGVCERDADGAAWEGFAALPLAAVASAVAYGDAIAGVLVLGGTLVRPAPAEGLDRQLVAAFAGLAARALHAARDTAGEMPGARDVAALQRRYPPLRQFHGSSVALRDLCEQLIAVAPSPCAVALTGEPGSGRSLAARVLHDLSPRAGGPFSELDCALLPPPLLERALFGEAAHDDVDATPGLCRLHAGGTLALAQIESLAPSTQEAIAAFLRTGRVRRVGERTAERADVRLVALAAGDLRGDSGRPRLREDLAYRLGVFSVRVPGLTERDDDVPALVAQFLAVAADAHGRPSWQVSPDALQVLRRCPAGAHVGYLRRVVAALARTAAHDMRITAVHVDRALREFEGDIPH